MKKSKRFMTILSVILMTAMLSGCIAVEMRVNGNGSCDITYTIDTSGLLSKSEVEKTIKEIVEKQNQRAGKNVAILKSIKEDKEKGIITALLSISNINDMGDGSFFGTVRHYRMKDGTGLDGLVDKKGRAVNEKDIPEDLYVVYTPGFEQESYGIIKLTIIVPGDIQYLTGGAEIQKSNVAYFSGETALVVFKKGGGGFPYWILLLAGAIFIICLIMKRKPTIAPVVSPPVTTHAPESVANFPTEPKTGSVSAVPGVRRSSEEV